VALPLSNLLVDSLPAQEKGDLVKLLEPVPLPLKTSIFEASQAPRFVHFITSGLTSSVMEMSKGATVEVSLTGRESLPESIFLLGPQKPQMRCFMQIEGTGLRMDFKQFQKLFREREALNRAVLRHVQYESLLTAQLVACNRLHEVEERLSRWLLMVSDRIGSDTMFLTQEFLSDMLGARRSTVTIAAGTLQRTGAIEYRRGQVRITNRESLEDTACECYTATKRLLQSLHN
jgi:CRP-like cAMP-binding protein